MGDGRQHKKEVDVDLTRPELADLASGFGPDSSKALIKDAQPVLDQAKVQDQTKTTDAARENDRLRLNYLQLTLHNLLPAVVQGKSDKQLDPATIKDLQIRQADIKAEQERSQFGPATKKAYGEYIDWLQNKAVPTEVARLKAYQLEVANGNKMLAFDKPIDFKIKSDRPPDDNEMMRLDNAVTWIQQAEKRIKPAEAAMLQQVDQQMASTIRQNGLPKGWLTGVDLEKTDPALDANRDAWRQSAGKLVNTALSARTYIEVIDELNKSSDYQFQNTLPSGATVERDQHGKISRINLNLPQTWSKSSEGEQKKAETIDQWLKESKGELAPVLGQLREYDKKPERAISWGDTELKDTQGRFDKDGNLLGLVKKGEPARPGETLKDVNLLQSRFSTEEKDGKITIHQEVQAQSVPWWGYQNLIGVDNVGKKLIIDRTYDKDQRVIVRNGHGYENVKAEDLGSHAGWEMTKYFGEKGLMSALDAGMVASGSIEVGAAFKAGRVAEVASELALKKGVDNSLTGQIAKGLLRATVGGAGLFNNAGARESDAGEYVNTARSVYFLTDIGAGLATGGWRALRGLNKGELLQPAKTLPGLTAGTFAERMYQGSHTLFKASEVGFVPLVSSDIYSQLSRIKNDKAAHINRAITLDALENGRQ